MGCGGSKAPAKAGDAPTEKPAAKPEAANGAAQADGANGAAKPNGDAKTNGDAKPVDQGKNISLLVCVVLVNEYFLY